MSDEKVIRLQDEIPSDEEMEKYDGYWVAVSGGAVVGYGKSPATAIKRAKAKGFEIALLFHAPLVKRGVRHYYRAA